MLPALPDLLASPVLLGLLGRLERLVLPERLVPLGQPAPPDLLVLPARLAPLDRPVLLALLAPSEKPEPLPHCLWAMSPLVILVHRLS